MKMHAWAKRIPKLQKDVDIYGLHLDLSVGGLQMSFLSQYVGVLPRGFELGGLSQFFTTRTIGLP
jgi:hypothetical protein